MQTQQLFTPQPPTIFQGDAQSISDAGSELCHNLQQHVADLVSTVSPGDATFDNVLVKLLQHENGLQLTSNLVTLYSLAGTDGPLRSAAAETAQKISHAQMDCKENADLFRLVNSVYERQKDDPNLDVDSRKALIEERRSYVRKGMDLAASDDGGEACHEVRDIARQLGRISSEFMRNLDEKEHSIWLTRQDLGGVPDDALSGLEIGTGEMDGKFRLDLNGPEVRWFMTMASSPATREMMYLGTKRVASTFSWT